MNEREILFNVASEHMYEKSKTIIIHVNILANCLLAQLAEVKPKRIRTTPKLHTYNVTSKWKHPELFYNRFFVSSTLKIRIYHKIRLVKLFENAIK